MFQILKHVKSRLSMRKQRDFPSEHLHLGPMWNPDGLKCGTHVGFPPGARSILSMGSNWGPYGLPTWAITGQPTWGAYGL